MRLEEAFLPEKITNLESLFESRESIISQIDSLYEEAQQNGGVDDETKSLAKKLLSVFTHRDIGKLIDTSLRNPRQVKAATIREFNQYIINLQKSENRQRLYIFLVKVIITAVGIWVLTMVGPLMIGGMTATHSGLISQAGYLLTTIAKNQGGPFTAFYLHFFTKLVVLGTPGTKLLFSLASLGYLTAIVTEVIDLMGSGIRDILLYISGRKLVRLIKRVTDDHDDRQISYMSRPEDALKHGELRVHTSARNI